MAVGAWPLDHEETLFGANLALTVAEVAGACTGARRGAGAMAGLAILRHFDFDLGRFAVEGILELDLHVIAQIGTAAWTRAPAATEGAAEDGLEDIADITEIGPGMASASRTALLEGGVAVAIVGRTLLRILEHFIGGTHRLELALAFGAAGIAVGVVLHCELAIGGLDRRAVGIAAHPEQFVEIGFGRRHGFPMTNRHRCAGAPVATGFSSSDQFFASSSTSENSASTTSSSAPASDAASPSGASVEAFACSCS